jgi:hypothetical protein
MRSITQGKLNLYTGPGLTQCRPYPLTNIDKGRAPGWARPHHAPYTAHVSLACDALGRKSVIAAATGGDDQFLASFARLSGRKALDEAARRFMEGKMISCAVM